MYVHVPTQLVFFGFTANGVADLHLIIIQLNLKSTWVFFKELRIQIQFTITIVS